MTIRETLARAVRAARTRRGYTQAQTAEMADLSADTIRKLEGGKFSPTLDTLQKVASGLSVPLRALVAELEGAPPTRTPRDYVRDARVAFIDGRTDESMTRLAEAFSVLRGKPGVDPWEPETLAQEAARVGPSSTRHAARFVLSVYDTDAEPFDVHAAMQAWDGPNLAAFQAWVSDPWWA